MLARTPASETETDKLAEKFERLKSRHLRNSEAEHQKACLASAEHREKLGAVHRALWEWESIRSAQPEDITPAIINGEPTTNRTALFEEKTRLDAMTENFEIPIGIARKRLHAERERFAVDFSKEMDKHLAALAPQAEAALEAFNVIDSRLDALEKIAEKHNISRPSYNGDPLPFVARNRARRYLEKVLAWTREKAGK